MSSAVRLPNHTFTGQAKSSEVVLLCRKVKLLVGSGIFVCT